MGFLIIFHYKVTAGFRLWKNFKYLWQVMNSKEPVFPGTRLFDMFSDFLRTTWLCIPNPYPLVLSLEKERTMQHWSSFWRYKTSWKCSSIWLMCMCTQSFRTLSIYIWYNIEDLWFQYVFIWTKPFGLVGIQSKVARVGWTYMIAIYGSFKFHALS